MAVVKRISINGDVALDHLTWEVEAFEVCPYQHNTTEKAENNWKLYKGYRRVTRKGGAVLLAEFIKASIDELPMQTRPEVEIFKPEIEQNDSHISDIIQSQCILSFFENSNKRKDEKPPVRRISRFCGFIGPGEVPPGLRKIVDDPDSADIILLDDAGNSFRDREEYWPRALRDFLDKKPLVVLKMSRPLFRGSLFFYCLEKLPDLTILIINGNDLRDLGVKISRQLSWEQTIHDFLWNLLHNPKLAHLRSFSHFIIRFGLDGALYCYKYQDQWAAKFYYSHTGSENEFQASFEGTMQGYNNAFIGGLVQCLVRLNNSKDDLIPKPELDLIGDGIRTAICAERRLLKIGFTYEKDGPNYPFESIYNNIEDDLNLISSFPVPSHVSESTDSWTILEELTQKRLDSIAFNLVEYGSDPLLEKVPIQSYGPLKVIDRNEIESYQSIKNLIVEYLKRDSKITPLSIAVFGAPGSGKSFGISKLAESIAKDKIKKIEFNMTQFSSPQDLVNAFHRIRDCSLTGKIPLVFFDEFDVTYREPLGWLKYFLAPMQDGEFVDQGFRHPIGKSIFIFAGGTRHTFQEFCQYGQQNNSQDHISSHGCTFNQEFQNVKGPDFLSRLRGYINIKGIDSKGPEDRLFIIRRALILRNLLESSAPGIIRKGGHACIDSGILSAFLRVKKFKHGVRSMVAIIEMSMISKLKSYEQASLPVVDQLELHVDAKEFLTFVESEVLTLVLFGQALEDISRAIHEKYREDNKSRLPQNDPSMLPWDQLTIDLQESNRQQAINIPEKLRAVNHAMIPKIQSDILPFSFTLDEIEKLAEQEHIRFVDERKKAGWKLGPKRDPINKISPFLVPWNKLDEPTKDIDRKTVTAISEIIDKAGFQIIALPGERGC